MSCTGGVESFEYLWLSKAMVWSHLCRGVCLWKSPFLGGAGRVDEDGRDAIFG